MIYDLQKASILKRIAAGIFDFILTIILAVGIIALLSVVFEGEMQPTCETSVFTNSINPIEVPIKYKNKNGMEKQVGKSDVFTKESLITLQNKMRTLCIEEFNQEYNLDSTLKKKQKGRNMDIHVSDMDNYIALKKQLEK